MSREPTCIGYPNLDRSPTTSSLALHEFAPAHAFRPAPPRLLVLHGQLALRRCESCHARMWVYPSGVPMGWAGVAE